MNFRISSAAVAVSTLALGALIGAFFAAPPTPDADASTASDDKAGSGSEKGGDPAANAEQAKAKTLWTCSMHPQIKLPEKGLCPICNMDLIPLQPADESGGGQIKMTANAVTLARIATTKVKRADAEISLRMVGKVTYDETRVSRLTAWFGGRIERLFVDFTGTVVKKGDHMLALYSPELLVAQQELIAATRDFGRAGGPLKDAARATVRAARDKLRLWGLQDWQIRSVQKRGRPLETVTIYAPMGGVVTHKAALEGSWVKTGTPIYTIADLSHVWVELEAYESDIAWLRYGQRVHVQVDAFPGQPFAGAIAFVSPVLNEKTRTVKVRVHVDNPDLQLKPGMFVRATAKVPVTGGGTSGAAQMASKHVCPMHPEVVSAKPARCRICGMKLVAAEKHWLVGPALRGDKADKPLLIPHTAPLITGKRAVVFVEKQGAKEPTYLVREVTLGPRAGAHYIVVDGLMAGEMVVSHGAFRLDSAMQIVGDPSVMSHEPKTTADNDADDDVDKQPTALKLSSAAIKQLAKVAGVLVEISAGLAADDNAKAAKAAAHLHHKIDKLVAAVNKARPGDGDKLKKAAATVADSKAKIDARRNAYVVLNTMLIPTISRYAAQLRVTHDHVYCPMANDNSGAGWLQKPGEVANPYFGASMLRCGGKKGGFAGKKP